jgi:hypothetical protein
MPTMDQNGETYGYVVRKLDGQVGPKTLSFLDGNKGAWYGCEGSSELVIVEDQLSALRASEYMNAVALLGVNMTDEVVRCIEKAPGYTGIFLALDADAFPTAIKLAHRVRPKFKMKVMKLKQDLKNMNEQELIDTLYEAGAEFYQG